mgnify:CR=1 FL=1|jgi:hypothetical protein
MIIEKGRCYGRTSDEVREFGYPEDNMSNIKVDNEIVLTGDEVAEMFPNQYVVLKILEYKDIDALSSFTKAIVKYFKCDGPFSAKTAEFLRKEYPGDIYISETYYDPGMEGDLLWF